MPLRAFLNNEEILSIDYNSQEWSDLKFKIKNENSSITLPCCKQTGFLRTSSKGLNHFVHYKNKSIICDWQNETPQHLKSKIEIIKACKKNGWQAIPEFSQNDWRADVLAIKKSAKIAFEVQWSKQTFEETRLRQENFKKDGVKGCWFFRIFPTEFMFDNTVTKAFKDLPIFKIFENQQGEIIVSLNSTEKGIFEFVDDLLNRRLKYCEHLRSNPENEFEISFYERECPNCKEKHLSYFTSEIRSCCGNIIPFAQFSNKKGSDFYQILEHSFYEIRQSGENKFLKLGVLRCDNCKTEFDDTYTISKQIPVNVQELKIIYKKKVKIDKYIKDQKHWCFSTNGNFCE